MKNYAEITNDELWNKLGEAILANRAKAEAVLIEMNNRGIVDYKPIPDDSESKYEEWDIF